MLGACMYVCMHCKCVCTHFHTTPDSMCARGLYTATEKGIRANFFARPCSSHIRPSARCWDKCSDPTWPQHWNHIGEFVPSPKVFACSNRHGGWHPKKCSSSDSRPFSRSYIVAIEVMDYYLSRSTFSSFLFWHFQV